MRSGARRLADQEPAAAREAPPAPEPALLDLQRAAGNAAVARLLQRQPYLISGDTSTAQKVLADKTAATQAVRDWFDTIAKPHEESGNIPGSVAELVHQACELPYTRADGTQGTVRDKIKPAEVEQQLRGRASSKDMRLTEHRDASDLGGVKSELEATLANLGAIPMSIELGDDDARVVASIAGKVKGEAKVRGGGKVEGELSSEGFTGTVKGPGAQYELGVTGKSIKATVKAGDLLSVKGGITRQEDGGVGWQAEIAVGSIGKLLMPEDVAKVFVAAQKTFGESAGELAGNLNDPEKIKQHGGALAGAIGDAVEKAKKSASQKAGWRVGAEIKGDGGGGVSGAVTLTWVF
jgi:hypothetical protein